MRRMKKLGATTVSGLVFGISVMCTLVVVAFEAALAVACAMLLTAVSVGAMFVVLFLLMTVGYFLVSLSPVAFFGFIALVLGGLFWLVKRPMLLSN